MKLYLFHPDPSTRLSYISRYLLENLSGLELNILTDRDVYASSDGAKINYSSQMDLPGLHVLPHGLLDEKRIQPQEVNHRFEDGLNQLFYREEQAAVPFDVFAAGFYLISRYEEYLPHEVDDHKRFLSTQSIAAQFGFLERAVVNRYALFLQEKLGLIYPSLKFKKTTFKLMSTVDVDSAYAYRQKGMMRTLGGYLKDVTKGDLVNLKERTKFVFSREQDPYDTYDFLLELYKKYDVHGVFFFLLADYALNDKGVSWRRPALQSLIKRMNDHTDIGIHPGYQSNTHFVKLKTEIERLERISKTPVKKSRQHFLMLRFPETYQRLVQNGIEEDHTMGYADQIGFRASVATPFPWFDLSRNIQSALTVVPFTFMDATLNMYLGYTPEEALDKVKPLIRECKTVGGQLIPLWHNETLSEKWNWVGWKQLLEQIFIFSREE